jgi:DNA-binding NarL/FixJ family response regulator
LDRIQVLLGPMPQLLREILTSGFVADPDVVIVGETGDDVSLLALCTERRPDVVVLQSDSELESRLQSTVSLEHDLKILAVATSGREARMHRLCWQVDVVSELSFGELRDAVVHSVPLARRLSSAGRFPPLPLE